MGQDIDHSSFENSEFEEFEKKLKQETDLLKKIFKEGQFVNTPVHCGLELESWIVDKEGRPFPKSNEFLADIHHSCIVPELAKFNFEINGAPTPLGPNVFSDLKNDLYQLWDCCDKEATTLGGHIMSVGILPSLQESDLVFENMSPNKRYLALNEQVLKYSPDGKIHLHMRGKNESLDHTLASIMTEAAATSLQIHLQVSPEEATTYYNLAQIISAPLVAITANSPFFFGKELWDESRIPVFEQVISVPSHKNAQGHQVNRVSLGMEYLQDSLLEAFQNNIDYHPILLPILFNEPPEKLKHMGFHNGTVWRWNRPLVGVNGDGTYHLRIEHRATSAGPTLTDVLANMALYIGVMLHLGKTEKDLPTKIPFPDVVNNFYECAKKGLRSELTWKDGQKVSLTELILLELMPAATQGLTALGIDKETIDYYIDEVIGGRVRKLQTGAEWQRAYVERHGKNFEELTLAYLQNQKTDTPVCNWKL